MMMTWLWLATIGCVPKKDYEALQAEMNAQKVALSAQVEERDARILTLEEALAAEQ